MEFFKKKVSSDEKRKNVGTMPQDLVVGDIYRLAYDFIVGKFRISAKGTVSYDKKDDYTASERQVISNWASFFTVGKSPLLFGSLFSTIMDGLEKDEKSGVFGELTVKDRVDLRLGFLEKYAEYRSEGYSVFGVKQVSELMESLIGILDENFDPYSNDELKYAILSLPNILLIVADDKEQGFATPFRIATYVKFADLCEKKKLAEYAPNEYVPMLKELKTTISSIEKKTSEKKEAKKKALLKKIHSIAKTQLEKADENKAVVGISEAFAHFTKNRDEILKTLKNDVIGQDRQIESIFPFVGKTYVGMNRRPASFLFLGPSGVGKTRLGKMIAKRFGGGDPCMINLGNFHNSSTMSTILGSPPGYVNSGNETILEKYLNSINNSKELTAQLPVIIFDEFEKADPSIQNLLLEMLDLGTVTLLSGNVIDVKRSVVILTSNLGAARQRIGFESGDDDEIRKRNEEEMIGESRKFLKPEILNRLDQTVVFDELDNEDYARIRENVINDFVSETFNSNTALMKTVTDNGLSLDELTSSAKKRIKKNLKERLDDEDNLRLFEKRVENEIYETVIHKLSENEK